MRKDTNGTQGTDEPADDEPSVATGRDGKQWEDWGSSDSFTHGYNPDGMHFKRGR